MQAKLNAATTNVEYDTLRRQIAADNAAKEVLEMEILETLERVDQQQMAIQTVKQELQARKRNWKKPAPKSPPRNRV